MYPSHDAGGSSRLKLSDGRGGRPTANHHGNKLEVIPGRPLDAQAWFTGAWEAYPTSIYSSTSLISARGGHTRLFQRPLSGSEHTRVHANPSTERRCQRGRRRLSAQTCSVLSTRHHPQTSTTWKKTTLLCACVLCVLCEYMCVRDEEGPPTGRLDSCPNNPYFTRVRDGLSVSRA